MSDVALSMRRMSLTSVQLLSERVAPQPLTPHWGERERERQKGDKRGRRKDVQRSAEETNECGRGRGLMEGRRERFVKDNEAGGGVLLQMGGGKRGLEMVSVYAYTLNSPAWK